MIFIQDLAVIMLIAGMTTVLCHRLKQPVVLGYILAGIIIGPHTPPFSFITDESTIRTLAELGVIFLMFSLGLEFNIHKLKKVGGTAFLTATIEIFLMIAVGYEIGQLFGWKKIDSLFLGAILAISSTTIIVKALDELKLKKTEFAQLIFGILIVEDIFAVLLLTLLSSIAVTGSLQVSELLLTSTKLFSFLVISLLIGITVVPRILSYIAKFNSDEMLLISVLGLCFGFSLIVIKLDYSVALGAFIIGAVIAESKELVKIESLINPIRDMFSAIFFVSVGLLFDLQVVMEYLLPIFVITSAVVIGKVISCSIGTALTGHDGKTSLRVGMGLAQIGEFSFIIASLGITLQVTSTYLYSIAVGVSIITTLLTPYLIKHSDTFAQLTARFIPKNVADIFNVYTSWINSIQPGKDQLMLKKAINQSITHVVINLFIIIAVFLSCAYLAKSQLGHMFTLMTNIYIQKTLFWATALIISLPFIVAAYRKMAAISMILAEMSVKHANRQLTINIRKIIAEIIPILYLMGIVALITLLSASILPPFELVAITLILAISLVAFLKPWLIKIHSKLQINFMDSLKKHD